jgi:hypothetical protein
MRAFAGVRFIMDVSLPAGRQGRKTQRLHLTRALDASHAVWDRLACRRPI